MVCRVECDLVVSRRALTSETSCIQKQRRLTIQIPMSNNPRITLYKEAMSLEEQRSRLQAELDRITSRLSAVQSQLFEDGSPAVSTVAISATPATPSARATRRSRGRAGR